MSPPPPPTHPPQRAGLLTACCTAGQFSEFSVPQLQCNATTCMVSTWVPLHCPHWDLVAWGAHATCCA